MEKCKKGMIWDGTKRKCIKNNAPNMVGDGKLPNRYWVSLGNDRLKCEEDEDGVMVCDPIEKDPKGGTAAVFDTYEEARDYMLGIDIGEWVEVEGENFDVSSKRIEDRFSGELADVTIHEYEVRETREEAELYESTDFTRDAMKKLGATFK